MGVISLYLCTKVLILAICAGFIECMFYGVVGKFGGSWYRLSVKFTCFTSSPPLVFGDVHNRHNELTLDRVENMGHVFHRHIPNS